MHSNHLRACVRTLSLFAAFLVAFWTTDRAQADVSVKVFKDIVVIGDSLADGLHSGLYRLLKEEKSERKLSKKTKISSGLVRQDKFNWQKAIKRIAAKKKHELAIVSFGANDLTSFRRRGGSVHYNDKRWDGLYGERVKDVVKALKAGGMTVYWVGIPITRKNRYQKDYARLNKVFKAASTEAGATYIDTWSAFAVKGKYSAYGKNLKGKSTKLRHTDGVHFTATGYKVYAKVVLDAIPEPMMLVAQPEVAQQGS